jgi:hypothetical protein
MTDQTTMTVTKNGRWWDVIQHGVVVESFTTNAAAWRYIDRCDGDPVSKGQQRPEFWWERD